MDKRGRPKHPDILTPREWEVLALLRHGCSNEELAQRLGISLAGAKYHVSEILSKLGVSSREEAARWSAEGGRPWWSAAFAPLAFLWRPLRSPWLAGAAAGALVTAAVAGAGVLMWATLTDGRERANIPIRPPQEAIPALLECYAPITEGVPQEDSELAPLAGASASVSVAGAQLDPEDSDYILSLLSQAQPIYFGVRGYEIGQRDLHEVQLEVAVGGRTLAYAYIPPSAVTQYGLLFSPTSVGSWDYIGLLDPPGYAQAACSVPLDLQDEMARLDHGPVATDEILEYYIYPFGDGRREFGLERIDVRPEPGEARVSIDLAEEQADLQLANLQGPAPVEPFVGAPITVRVWPMGFPPITEAVRPGRYLYYDSDASGSARGVLVEQQAPAVSNGSTSFPNGAAYATAEFDALIRDVLER